ncbi:GMC oxidoreductase-like protein [Cercophora scortea]|uniref:GMC oxidoreductase-like protein n=1 Tax=Cercophora scortea TaxID=314031 RepID=A0AAE0I8B0_9PEZI|nr:GMC oxidoreductase-like protein [Cercophora scortea]
MLLLRLFTLASHLVAVAKGVALPHDAPAKRQVSQLRDSYDFIIAGAGTSGLTVADRLSEAFPTKSVLVVEYGTVEYAPGVFDPPEKVWSGSGHLASSFNFQSLPIPDVLNKTALTFGGKVVGGSSAINGMFADRGSRYDYDAWAELQTGSPEFDGLKSSDKWTWEGLYPFFKKSITFTAPPVAVAEKQRYTWNATNFGGGTTPIYLSFPEFQWGDHHVLREAWRDMGIWVNRDCAGGDKDGICWVPNSQHPVTARRSYSGLGHYADVKDSRKNYDLLVKHQVTRVVYPGGNPRAGPPLVEIRSLDNTTSQLFNLTATADVIISAGVFHTPAILQRSGIGPAPFLRKVGIPVVIDLPGVGSNLQDHSGPRLMWNYTTPGNFSPQPDDLLNPAFLADALAGFNETPARGPYTLAMSNSAIYMPLPNMTIEYFPILDKIRRISAAANGSSEHAARYLSPDQRSDPTLVSGYQHQLAVIADFLANPKAPCLETAFTTGFTLSMMLLHPLSRGTVRLDPKDHLQMPLLDYRSASNPVDFDLHIVHTNYLRRLIQTPTMQQYGTMEVLPGANVTTDAQILDFVKDQMVFSYMHACCTAAMLPRSKGGVVGPDLKVHGAKGLRVVDASVFPMLLSGHLSMTAYTVGEKAADIIVRQWKREWGKNDQ